MKLSRPIKSGERSLFKMISDGLASVAGSASSYAQLASEQSQYDQYKTQMGVGGTSGQNQSQPIIINNDTKQSPADIQYQQYLQNEQLKKSQMGYQ